MLIGCQFRGDGLGKSSQSIGIFRWKSEGKDISCSQNVLVV